MPLLLFFILLVLEHTSYLFLAGLVSDQLVDSGLNAGEVSQVPDGWSLGLVLVQQRNHQHSDVGINIIRDWVERLVDDEVEHSVDCV